MIQSPDLNLTLMLWWVVKRAVHDWKPGNFKEQKQVDDMQRKVKPSWCCSLGFGILNLEFIPVLFSLVFWSQKRSHLAVFYYNQTSRFKTQSNPVLEHGEVRKLPLVPVSSTLMHGRSINVLLTFLAWIRHILFKIDRYHVWSVRRPSTATCSQDLQHRNLLKEQRYDYIFTRSRSQGAVTLTLWNFYIQELENDNRGSPYTLHDLWWLLE